MKVDDKGEKVSNDSVIIINNLEKNVMLVINNLYFIFILVNW